MSDIGINHFAAIHRRCLLSRNLRASMVALILCLFVTQSAHAQSIDGGRSDLPGMKQDIFDQVQKSKKMKGQNQRGKAPPDCPKSDMMSAFYSLAFAGSEIYVRVNATEGKCEKLISIGGANYANLTNYSKSCGPVGEWKRRIAENMSSVFFQGGYESWAKSENDVIEVVTEDGTYEAVISEEKYEHMMGCWKQACSCEQANNPIARMIMMAMLVIAIGGVGVDFGKVLWQKIKGKKPPKHVECKNGHRMEEVKYQDRHFCDVCKLRGTTYKCANSCNYDMCKKCYKAAKAKAKAEWEKWCEKHPEDKKKKKKDKEEDDEGKDSDNEKKSDADTGKETGDESGKESGKETDTSKTEDDKSEKSEKDDSKGKDAEE